MGTNFRQPRYGLTTLRLPPWLCEDSELGGYAEGADLLETERAPSVEVEACDLCELQREVRGDAGSKQFSLPDFIPGEPNSP